MPNHLKRLGGVALSLALAGALTPALAQKKQPWVDPPATIPAGSPEVEAVEPDPGEPASPAATGATSTAPLREDAEAPRAAGTKAAAAPSRKAAAARAVEPNRIRRAERPVRKVAAAASRRPARVAARAPGRGDRLELMTLRTIEFDDGRRVTILTRPDAATVSRFMAD